MPGPILRRAALLTFVFLCAAVESPPGARAAQDAPPATLHGFLRYEVRGLTAVSGGFLAGMFAVQGMYVAMAHRALPNFLKILSGMAKLSKDPSLKETHDFLRSGGPAIDLSSLPVSASYGVELEFTLEEVKGGFRLKRGSYRWSSETFASVSAGEAEMTDKFRGQGSGALDPNTSSITLTHTGKRGSRQTHFDVFVNFPRQVDGKALMKNGPMSLSYATRGDKVIFEGQMGVLADIREVRENPPSQGGVTFSKNGPAESVMKGFEVYQDLLDSGVVEEWELWDDCDAVIKFPEDKEELVYNDKEPGQLKHRAFAQVRPTFWGDDMYWLLPQIAGSEHEPQEPEGNDLDIVYTNLPRSNSEFGFRQLNAVFGPKAKAAGCKDPELTKPGYFFPTTGTNNPGPSKKAEGNSEKGPDPNWFYYWGQTSAAQGRSAELKYGATSPDCNPPEEIFREIVDGKEVTTVDHPGGPIYGYYPWGKPYVVICDLKVFDFHAHNPYTEWNSYGIDTYAVTVLHELKHKENYRKWWRAGWSWELDSDRDHIPDLLEGGIRVPPPLNTKHTFFDPQERDTVGEGVNDEHYLAWMAEAEWKMQSAEAEDWSCPGQQASKCQE